MVVNGVLRLITQSKAESDVGLHSPVILNIRFDVVVSDLGIGRARNLRKLSGLPALKGGHCGKSKRAIKSRSGIVRILRSAHACAELDGLIAVNQRCVVLNLVSVLTVVEIARTVPATNEAPKHVHRRIFVVRVLQAVITQILKTGLIDDLRANDLRIANLQRVFRRLGVVRLGWQTELTGKVPSFGVAVILKSSRQRVVLVQSPIQSR